MLDFGLAKALERPAEAGRYGEGPNALSMSPTLSIHATQAGLILGTAAYMSPEQAAGKPVDKRSDVWSFGVVVLEMLTGQPVFTGETVSHVLASVLKSDPDWTTLPASMPPRVVTVLRRCLHKDRKQRVRDIGDVSLALDGAFETAAPQSAVGTVAPRRWVAWAAVALLAQGFDTTGLTLVGDPSPIVEIPGGIFSVSTSGVLAYQAGTDANRRRLAWFDRTGQSLGALGEAANYYTVEISPDGTHAAGGILEPGGPALGDIWLYDLTGNSRTRLTFDAANTLGRAVWAPDGTRVVSARYTKNGNDKVDVLYEQASDGAGGEQALLEDGVNKFPLSWSPDGRFLLYAAVPGSPTTGNDLMVLPLVGGRKPFPYLQTRFNEFYGVFSPDGRWVAYASNESGRTEVYVAAFPGPGGKRQISTTGGSAPRWRRDGKEIFYLDLNNTMMAAAVNGQGAAFDVTSVKALFEARAVGESPYDVSADGQRFLIVRAADDASAAGITVAVNATAGPKNERGPAK